MCPEVSNGIDCIKHHHLLLMLRKIGFDKTSLITKDGIVPAIGTGHLNQICMLIFAYHIV